MAERNATLKGRGAGTTRPSTPVSSVDERTSTAPANGADDLGRMIGVRGTNTTRPLVQATLCEVF